MTRCPEPEQLEQLLADGLTGPEAEGVEAHVEACARCQQALERLTGADAGADFLRRLEKELPGAPTSPYRDGLVSEPPGRIHVALVAGAGQQSTRELETLLRKRLLIVASILLGGEAIGLPLSYLGGNPMGSRPAFVLLSLTAVAVTATLTAILRRRPPLSLRALRVIELILFGTPLLLFTALMGVALRRGSLVWVALMPTGPLGESSMSLGARFAGLPWFALIVMYGIFIPNTGRRCAAVVSLMALAPVAVHAAGGLTSPALDKRLLLVFLLELSLWVVMGAAIAIYGSHRIEVLRREAAQARKLGQYRLKRLLGSGGMGEVYLAEHVLLRRPCAIKLIRPERAGDPQNRLRFEREVQATVTLTHPNTVRVYDYGHAEGGTFYYVMEYLPGLSLEQLVRRHGPLPPERVVHLLRQVCGALQEAHAAGLVHRDLKPQNVLVCEQGGVADVAKLLDFGLVQAHGLGPAGQQLTQPGALAGTPAYMSPEQAAGKEVDGRSDLYSLGAVAYYLLTGRPPFVRETAVETLAAHLGEEVVAPDRYRAEVPADLQAVVLRCLEKDPDKRFPDADALERALAGCGCAGGWTRERAGAWWREQAVGGFGEVPQPGPPGP
jgi:serine/threonine-protein kinase